MNETSKPRILIVDDSVETLELFELQLKNKYKVDTATSLKAGKELLDNYGYHIAIIDLILPGENGLDLIQYVTQSYPHTAVIAISGQASIETAVRL